MQNLWLGWLIVMASAFTSAVAVAEEPLLALNMQPRIMHTIDELLNQFSSEELPAAERIRLLEQGKVTVSDGVTNSGDSYYANYEFEVAGLHMRSKLTILLDALRAEQASSELLAGARAGFQNQGISLEDIPNPPDSRYSGKYFMLLNRTGAPIGSLSIVSRGSNVYFVESLGAVVSGTGAEMEEFMVLKAERVLSFVPQFGEKSALAAQEDKDRLQRQTRLFGWIFIYTFVYFSARGFIGLLNITIRPKSLNGRTAGVLCILTLATSAGIYLQHIVVNSNPEEFARIEPYEQGQMIGHAISEPAVPALFVLLAIGIATYIRNTRSPAASDSAH
jgi:hypothetical protein